VHVFIVNKDQVEVEGNEDCSRPPRLFAVFTSIKPLRSAPSSSTSPPGWKRLSVIKGLAAGGSSACQPQGIAIEDPAAIASEVVPAASTNFQLQ
jgi:hypothetical protein